MKSPLSVRLQIIELCDFKMLYYAGVITINEETCEYVVIEEKVKNNRLFENLLKAVFRYYSDDTKKLIEVSSLLVPYDEFRPAF